jgi:hypothetical protein
MEILISKFVFYHFTFPRAIMNCLYLLPTPADIGYKHLINTLGTYA